MSELARLAQEAQRQYEAGETEEGGFAPDGGDTMNDMMTILGINAYIQRGIGRLSLDEKEIVCVALDSTCTFEDGSEVALTSDQLAHLAKEMQDSLYKG